MSEVYTNKTYKLLLAVFASAFYSSLYLTGCAAPQKVNERSSLENEIHKTLHEIREKLEDFQKQKEPQLKDGMNYEGQSFLI